jgi:hypothetical protein
MATKPGSRPNGNGKKLELVRFGPIASASIEFGDLTVLVGPQATGKSIFLQTLKLLEDLPHVKDECERAGTDWGGDFGQFLDVFYGEGMRSLWRPSKSRVVWNGEPTDLKRRVESEKAQKGESLFFIPAQRVITLRDGWPQAFAYYDPGVPFVVREFSEKLRLMMTGAKETFFPVHPSLKPEFQELIARDILPRFELRIDTDRAQRRLVLSSDKEETPLPFMVWSAGQREFVPLLLGLYWLMTSSGASKRKGVEWVVIEEPEMGLHPRAVEIVILMIFELIKRGYRVCLSTHSPQVLDAVWVLRYLKMAKADPKELLRVFEVPTTERMIGLARTVMKKQLKVHYFDRESGKTRDISDLDANSEDAIEAGWGGLTDFSGRAIEAVARAVAASGIGG